MIVIYTLKDNFTLTTYKNLFKQTIIYGVATVLPRVISFLLVSLHTIGDAR